MYWCMNIHIVTLLSIYIHQRSAAIARRPALHSRYAVKISLILPADEKHKNYANKYSLKY